MIEIPGKKSAQPGCPSSLFSRALKHRLTQSFSSSRDLSEREKVAPASAAARCCTLSKSLSSNIIYLVREGRPVPLCWRTPFQRQQSGKRHTLGQHSCHISDTARPKRRGSTTLETCDHLRFPPLCFLLVARSRTTRPGSWVTREVIYALFDWDKIGYTSVQRTRSIFANG